MKRSSMPLSGIALHALILFLPWGAIISPAPGVQYHAWFADFLLAACVLPTVGFLLVRRRAILIPPLGIQVMLLAFFACLIMNSSTSLVKASQLSLYAYGGWLIVYLAQNGQSLHKGIFFALIFNLVVFVGMGCYQSLFLRADDYLVRGFLPNYHVFSAYIMIGFLYVFPVLLIQRSWLFSLLALMLGAGLCLSVKSPPSIIAFSLGLLAQVVLIAYFQTEWANSKLVLSSLGAMALLAIGVFVQPRNLENVAEFLHPYEPADVDMRFSRIQQIVRLPLREAHVGGLLIGAADPFLRKIDISPSRKYEELNNQHLITQRLVERLVSMNMVEKNLGTGVGLGRYQEAKDLYFGSVVKVNTTEPYSYSSLSIVLGTGGIIAFIGILFFIFGQLFNVVRDFQRSRSRRAMLIGAFGSAIAFVCLAYQIDVLIAPTFVLFVVLSTFGIADSQPQIEAALLGSPIDKAYAGPGQAQSASRPAPSIVPFQTRGSANG